MSSTAGPVAAILIPTHDHASTLDLAVRSALEQTVAEIEVLVVGDGVDDGTRGVVAGLRQEDPRVRFLDLPKGPNHGEIHRGAAIETTSAEIVCYLCDDDLLLPEHVETMAGLLADADLAHCQSGHVETDGSFHPYLADLELQRCREWVLRPDRNAVSLTGTAHTVSAYRRLPHGWRTTPPGRAPDHYMWQQFLAQPWVRAVTGTRATALQLPSHLEGRAQWPAERRRAELRRWRAELATAEGRARFDESVRRGVMTRATGEQIRRDEVEDFLAAEEKRRAELESRLAAAEFHLRAIGSTRTWRLRSRLRRIWLLRALARATARRRPG
jgi:glycosyltransferase involved in cell wall biosynthesis